MDADARRKTPVSFGPFQSFTAGEYTYQRCLVKFSAEVESNSESIPEVSEFVHHVDVPNVVKFGSFIFMTAQKETVSFSGDAYQVVPTVTANVIAGLENTYVQISNITTTGFDAEIRRISDGTLTTGTISYIAVAF